MANLETLSKSVETKLQMLKFTNEDVKQVLEGKHVPSTERKVKTLQGKIDEIHELQTIIQERRIKHGDDMESIRAWTTKIDGDCRVYEGTVSDLNRALKDLQKAESEQARREEEEFASELRQRKFEQEMKFEEASLHYDKKEPKSSEKPEKESKLHKLSKACYYKV